MVRAREQCVSELQQFVDHARAQRLPASGAAQTDAALVSCMSYMFLNGEQARRGEKLLAGLMARAPEYSSASLGRVHFSSSSSSSSSSS